MANMVSSEFVNQKSNKVIDSIRDLITSCNTDGDQSRNLQFMRDSLAIGGLGFDMVNASNTGWDGMRSSDGLNIESKTTSITTKNYGIICEDTTKQKALRFGTGDVAIALTVFADNLYPMFSVVGNNPEIANELLIKSDKKRAQGKRENVRIPMNKLIKKYGFNIVARNDFGFTKADVVEHLQSKYKKAYKNLTEDMVLTANEVIINKM